MVDSKLHKWVVKTYKWYTHKVVVCCNVGGDIRMWGWGIRGVLRTLMACGKKLLDIRVVLAWMATVEVGDGRGVMSLWGPNESVAGSGRWPWCWCPTIACCFSHVLDGCLLRLSAANHTKLLNFTKLPSCMQTHCCLWWGPELCCRLKN